jgi:hypothetical protein
MLELNQITQIVDREYLGQTIIRPRLMSSILVNVIRHYFSQPNLLVTERFKFKPNMGMEPESQNSVLIISSASRQLDRADERPAIVVRRLEWQVIPLGIGDGIAQYKPNDENTQYVVSFKGAHVIYAHSREQGEVEALVDELINCFVRLAPLLRRILKLARFRLVQVDKVSMYTTNRDYFVCPLVLQYMWSENWFIDRSVEEMERVVLTAIQTK